MKSKSKARTAAPESERACAVAWLLKIEPDTIFQIKPDTTAEDNDHLVECVVDYLERLVKNAARIQAKPGDKPARFFWAMRTLRYCCDVMDGTAEPPPRNDLGEFDNVDGYRRGVFLLEGEDV